MLPSNSGRLNVNPGNCQTIGLLANPARGDLFIETQTQKNILFCFSAAPPIQVNWYTSPSYYGIGGAAEKQKMGILGLTFL
jgi:hypothetical protein